MTTSSPSFRLLIALFDLMQSNEEIDLFSLAQASGLNLYRTLAELETASNRGLLDVRRMRLTMTGLALAASLDRRSRRDQEACGRVYHLPEPGAEERQGAVEQMLPRVLVA